MKPFQQKKIENILLKIRVGKITNYERLNIMIIITTNNNKS